MKKTYKKTTNEIYVVFFHLYIVYVANVSDLIHTHFISNKRYIPNEMRKDRPRSVLSSLFGFHENLVSICSYVTKKKKCVNLLSTVHYTKHCEGKAMKPEVILFYNETKAGVDCLDIFYYKKVNKTMGCCVFLQRVDTMALAAFCICKEVDGLNKNSAKSKRNFLTTPFSIANSSCFDFSFISSIITKRFPFIGVFSFGKRKKSALAKSDDYCG